MEKINLATALIKKWEGLMLTAYYNVAHVPTIGYGTTVYPDGHAVDIMDTCTQAQAEEWLLQEVNKAIATLDDVVEVSLSNSQFAALVSLIYNIGVDAFKGSVLLKKLNQGDYEGAAVAFQHWNKADGEVVRGLINRRGEEEHYFRQDMPVASTDNSTGDDDENSKVVGKTYSEGNGPRITHEEVIDILRQKGANPDTEVCLLGIRGYYLDSRGKYGENDRGIYDDALIWSFPDGFMTFVANTDASKKHKGYGTGRHKGMANLKEGHWKYRMGYHKGYPAFTQAAPVTVIRDGNPDYEDTGWFGINIHRGGRYGTSSLGCHTLPRKTWGAFKALGYSQLQLREQKTFSYVLIHENERRNPDAPILPPPDADLLGNFWR